MCNPYQGGYLRRKYRKDRRPGLPVESPFLFLPPLCREYALQAISSWAQAIWRLPAVREEVEARSGGRATTPSGAGPRWWTRSPGSLETFTAGDGRDIGGEGDARPKRTRRAKAAAAK